MKFVATSVTVLFFLFAMTASTSGEPAAPEAVCTSNSAGDWNVAGRWSCGRVPTSADEVVVNHAVALDTNATILNLTVNGTLTFDNNSVTNHTLTVSGNVTINSGGIINVASSGPQRIHTFIVGGNFTNAGTFAGLSSNGNRVINTTFTGTGLQTISGGGATNFNNLTIDDGARVAFPATGVPTVEGAMTVNTGGAVQQTLIANTGMIPFLQISNSAATTVKYRGSELTPSVSALGSTTVMITTTVNGGCTTTGTGSPTYATRCYEITPANNAAATVRLYALTTSQLNGIAQANLRIYRYADGWQQLTTNASTGSASGSYSYAQADTPGFSAFLLGGPNGPTTVAMSSLTAQTQAPTWLPPIGLILLLGTVLLLFRRRAR